MGWVRGDKKRNSVTGTSSQPSAKKTELSYFFISGPSVRSSSVFRFKSCKIIAPFSAAETCGVFISGNRLTSPHEAR